jgi:hypothetical protein
LRPGLNLTVQISLQEDSILPAQAILQERLVVPEQASLPARHALQVQTDALARGGHLADICLNLSQIHSI